jgi:hypothetical protein
MNAVNNLEMFMFNQVTELRTTTIVNYRMVGWTGELITGELMLTVQVCSTI